MSAPVSAPVLALVLAGGQGRRMGGVDKGLQPWRGQALVDAVLAGIARQTRPVQARAISANRNAGAYAHHAHQAPVLPDRRPGWPGPLAGVEAGLAHLRPLSWQAPNHVPNEATNPVSHSPAAWLWTLPCDVPQFPAHTLAALLAQDTREPDGPEASDPAPRWVRAAGRDHPACALWPLACAPAVSAALDTGQNAVLRLLRDLGGRAVDIVGLGTADFANINTLDDLERGAH